MPVDTPLLYESKGSPNARRVRVFVAEKGIEIAQIGRAHV